MLNIISYKKWYFLLSLAMIVPGIIALGLWGLRLSIDFTGGSRIIYISEESVQETTTSQLEAIYEENGVTISTLQASDNQLIVRTSPIDETLNASIEQDISQADLPLTQDQFETIGPTIGQETAINSLKALGLASLLIILYIAWSFRKVPKPTSSFRFGITAIITLLHDVLILLGLFAILGRLFAVEVDSLFITAVLTVMGFSVHDTIVVFDRIRENLVKGAKGTFPQVVNDSILQTVMRSLNTSVTALLVLFSLLLFGGESIRWFIVALFVGVAVGTYSSIFNAAPLLVLWDQIRLKMKK